MAFPHKGSLANDRAVPSDGEDTIQSLSWSPAANHMAAASWDGKVRIYDVSSAGSARGVAALTAEAPVFSCHWAQDGNSIVAGGADKKIHIMDVSTAQQQVVGSHDAPVRGVRFADVVGTTGQMVVSGSWDRTIKFWDIRQRPGNAAATLSFDERVYSLDVKKNLVVVATADLNIHLGNLAKPDAPFKTVKSPLKHQTKTVTAFPNGKGWATTSIEGRCGVNAVDEEEARTVNFTFRCHRETIENRTKQINNIWAVNDVQFHPLYATTFVTAGSDGTFYFWDRVARARLSSYPPVSSLNTSGSSSTPTPPPSITATSFNRDGNLFAYAVGYDWSQGCVGNTPRTETKIMLHAVTEEDAKPKAGRLLGGLGRRNR
ncbi:WD40-repeat-containing domain protein [Ustulina deusta]|nr:WD40-repeat-containing domain protein [Ustulina deusta]